MHTHCLRSPMTSALNCMQQSLCIRHSFISSHVYVSTCHVCIAPHTAPTLPHSTQRRASLSHFLLQQPLLASLWMSQIAVH